MFFFPFPRARAMGSEANRWTLLYGLRSKQMDPNPKDNSLIRKETYMCTYYIIISTYIHIYIYKYYNYICIYIYIYIYKGIPFYGRGFVFLLGSCCQVQGLFVCYSCIYFTIIIIIIIIMVVLSSSSSSSSSSSCCIKYQYHQYYHYG